jgi:hypothetical protein
MRAVASRVNVPRTTLPGFVDCWNKKTSQCAADLWSGAMIRTK